VDRDAVRRYAQRPWAEIEAAKQRHWAEEFGRQGCEATFRAAQALWLHMRGVRPDWPTDIERALDLAHHTELKGRLDRAARGLTGR
jgi:hypothetical protein